MENLYISRQIKPEIFLEKLFLSDSKIPELNQNESLLVFCDEEITIEECEEALKTFKDNESPGNDGLTKDFINISGSCLLRICLTVLGISSKRGIYQ